MFLACTGFALLPAPQACALVATSKTAWRTGKGEKQETGCVWRSRLCVNPAAFCRPDTRFRFVGFFKVFHVLLSPAGGLGCPPNEAGVLILNRQVPSCPESRSHQLWLPTGTGGSHGQLPGKSCHHQECSQLPGGIWDLSFRLRTLS